MKRQVDVESQVEWNMAGLLNMELSRLRNEANIAFVNGNYRKAVACVMAMKHSCIQVIEEDDRKALKEMESKLIKYSKMIAYNWGFQSPPPIIIKVQSELEKLYMDYNESIQDILDNYGFLGGKKQDASKLVS